MTAQALILDFGGVITRSLFETHEMTERALKLKPGTLTWRGPFDPASDPLWVRMQRREISERDYWMMRTREVGQLVGEDWDRMDIFVQRARGAEPDRIIRPEAERAIRLAKAKGVRLAILSNELDLFYGTELRKRLPILDLFDVIVDATYTGILKPDPRAYALCLDRLALPASASVFVDDQLKNIEGADAIGLASVHFDVMNPAKSYSEALTMLGLADSFMEDHSNA